MAKLISTVYKSLLRSVNDLIDEVQATTGLQELEYWGWETRADEDQLPAKTLIGLDGYSFNENQGLWNVRCGITLSTYNDANLHHEAEILDVIHTLFGFQQKVPLRNAEGEIFSELYVAEFQVMPMGLSEIRNYRTVGLELLRTETAEA